MTKLDRILFAVYSLAIIVTILDLIKWRPN
jgi:hypothetical protein